jgi:hypothetical protein
VTSGFKVVGTTSCRRHDSKGRVDPCVVGACVGGGAPHLDAREPSPKTVMVSPVRGTVEPKSPLYHARSAPRLFAVCRTGRENESWPT